MSKKNHTLPVRFTSNGTAYRGFLSRSVTLKKMVRAFLESQEREGEEREGWGGGEWVMAARRMKGVEKPQARPTRRKPRVQRRGDGAGGGRGASASIVGSEELLVDEWWGMTPGGAGGDSYRRGP